MTHPLRLGIAGLGTVGVGVVKIVQTHADLLTARTGRPVTISAVSARSRKKDRGVDLSPYVWEDDPVALAARDDVDVLVELMGGTDGPARAATRAAITRGKHVVTANKAMLAVHGQSLAEEAEDAGVALRFEAAVAGGIPVVKALSESLSANRATRIMGVMNGTCNYILTRMESTGLPYAKVFKEAADLGYLEADPQLDVGGIDAGHKLALLASIAFGTQVDFDTRAGDMGYRIKLLGVAQMSAARGLEQRMTPCLVPRKSALGQLRDATNMVVIDGDSCGQIVLRGAGAGEGPTASAVMADVMDIARGIVLPVFGQPARSLGAVPPAAASAPAAWYLRLSLLDKPGALARIATVLGDEGLSIDRMRQYGRHGDSAPVLIVTHKGTRDALDHAMAKFDATGVLSAAPVAIRIEEV